MSAYPTFSRSLDAPDQKEYPVLRMNTKTVRSDLLMVLTAAIWGLAFVAQRVGMDYIGPFAFNGIRFGLGALSLTPFLFLKKSLPKKLPPVPSVPEFQEAAVAKKPSLLMYGFASGLVLYVAATLQQVGLVTTSAGNAGFITGLYVIIVPVMALVFSEKPGVGVWIGAALAALGLYFISDLSGAGPVPGDFLVLGCAFFFAVHVILIDRIARVLPTIPFSIIQFGVCSLLSLATAFLVEDITAQSLRLAAVPILYGGLGSVGIAYTLQIVAQKNAPPAHAAIILSLESLFAFLGGWIILHEPATASKLLGGALMLAGMFSAQAGRYIPAMRRQNKKGSHVNYEG